MYRTGDFKGAHPFVGVIQQGEGSPCWPEESKETDGSEVRALREFHEFGFAEPRIVAEESKGDSIPFGTRLFPQSLLLPLRTK